MSEAGGSRLAAFFLVEDEHDRVIARDGLHLVLFSQAPHQVLKAPTRQVLAAYEAYAGAGRLAFTIDEEGEATHVLPKAREDLLACLYNDDDRRQAYLVLFDHELEVPEFRFTYCGYDFDDPEWSAWPDIASYVSLWFPSNLVEGTEADAFARFALDLAHLWPYDSGTLTPSLAHIDASYLPEIVAGVRGMLFRHPGFEIPATGATSLSVGRRLPGVGWITFLGSKAIERLGGAAALRSALEQVGASVEAQRGGRLAVRLGQRPRVGDVNRRDVLDLHRAVAALMAPAFYMHEMALPGLDEEATERWTRRFLSGANDDP